MISANRMKDIGWLTRNLTNQEIKDYMVKHWDLLRKISRNADDDWAGTLIHALSKEDFEQIKKLI